MKKRGQFHPNIATTLEFFKGDALRTRTFLDKYALKDMSGQLLEDSPIKMWERVAREIAGVEKTPSLKSKWQDKFYYLLEDFRFIPGGRILFAAGSERKSTLLNCYVIPIKEDSIEGIFKFAQEEARTYSYGGGVGTDISILRPRGSIVHNSALFSTGSVSFMEIFSLVTGTIGQSGRRGALMLTISIDHPDVIHFIDIKSKPNERTKEMVSYMKAIFGSYFTDDQYKKIEEFLGTQQVRYANISVRVTDEFMRAVIENKDFTLRFESPKTGTIQTTVKARQLWDKLIYGAWKSAEPGIMFWDNIVKESTSEYNKMNVISTNPCSEIPLEPYGCCCLGNINLASLVRDPFGKNPHIDTQEADRLVEYGVRFLDNVITYSYPRHPLPEQAEESVKSRRIGLGFTGLGSMLAMLKVKYDSEEALNIVNKLFERIAHKAYETSISLAKEKGVFPLFDKNKHFKSNFIKRLPRHIKNKIKKYGLRNVGLLTVPPVGSGSILAGVSSGIEPIFALKYQRRSESLKQKEFWVEDHTLQKYRQISNTTSNDPVPSYFVTAHEIDPFFRVKMQATIQKYIDHAISSTINLPNSIDIKTVEQIYLEAWKLGCKSITVYREGSREGVLITEKELNKSKAKEEFRSNQPVHIELPFILESKRYRLKSEVGTVHINITRDQNNKLAEVFIDVGKSGSTIKAMAEGLGRQISLSLRRGVKPLEIIDQQIAIRGSVPIPNKKEFVFNGNHYTVLIPVFSLNDAVAKALLLDMFIHFELKDTELQSLGGIKLILEGKDTNTPNLINKSNADPEVVLKGKIRGEICSQCGGVLVFANGCYTCQDCGYSKCD